MELHVNWKVHMLACSISYSLRIQPQYFFGDKTMVSVNRLKAIVTDKLKMFMQFVPDIWLCYILLRCVYFIVIFHMHSCSGSKKKKKEKR